MELEEGKAGYEFHQYYLSKVEELQLNVNKSQNFQRLQAQRNEFNPKVHLLQEEPLCCGNRAPSGGSGLGHG